MQTLSRADSWYSNGFRSCKPFAFPGPSKGFSPTSRCAQSHAAMIGKVVRLQVHISRRVALMSTLHAAG